MSRVRIAKEFRWEMGHRLPYHTEGCQNVHGHSYRMEVEVEGTLDKGGMVLDYGDLDKVVRPLVARLDHSFMVDPTDTLMHGLLAESGLKATPVTFFSTAENIARMMMEEVRCALADRPNLTGLVVRVHETAKTVAEVSCPLGQVTE